MQVLSEQASRFYVLKNLKEKNSELFIIFFSIVLVGWIKSHLTLFFAYK